MSYEERVSTLLVRWMGGENLETAVRELTLMARSESERSYEEGYTAGYAFCKNETKLVETAASSLGK